jgi:nucleotide-binding universal stress UspA family protein
MKRRHYRAPGAASSCASAGKLRNAALPACVDPDQSASGAPDAGSGHRERPETCMKILLPVDGSRYTRRMLSYIAAHDELLGSGHEYLLFTVVPALSSRAAEFFDRRTLEEYYQDEAERALHAPRAFAGKQGWQARSAHAHGHAAEEIARFAAKERPDLIVMGTHGHSALGNVVLGSVANGVLARCKAPLLFVR